jgi:hypothetical protein
LTETERGAGEGEGEGRGGEGRGEERRGEKGSSFNSPFSRFDKNIFYFSLLQSENIVAFVQLCMRTCKT